MLLNPTYEWLLKQIKKDFPTGKISIIDYGCGNGYFLDLLPLKKVKTYAGFDVNAAGLQVAKARNLPAHFSFHSMSAGKVPHLGKKESVDLIILIGVFQYMKDQEIQEFLHHAYRTLRPGGRIISSSVVDKKVYTSTNLYQFVYPNRYLTRHQLEKDLEDRGYVVTDSFEKGLLLNPLFFHGAVLFFDAIDHYLLGTRGRLGLVGKSVRRLFLPILRLEFFLPFDFGYTWIFSAQKISRESKSFLIH